MSVVAFMGFFVSGGVSKWNVVICAACKKRYNDGVHVGFFQKWVCHEREKSESDD